MRRSPVRVDGALVGLHEALVRRVVRAAAAARAALDVGVALLAALLLDVDARARHRLDYELTVRKAAIRHQLTLINGVR